MTDNFEELVSLFVSDPSSAIEKSQQIITSVTEFDSYKDFYNYHLEHPHISTCQKEWAKPQMAIHCCNCSNHPQSCFCLQCFLEGQHPGHEYLVRPNSTGNCDCGDLSLWKRSGFCPKHYGLDEDSCPEDYLDEKLRNTLTDIIFKAAFSSLKRLVDDADEEEDDDDADDKFPDIIQFLMSFLKFGDGFRRLLVISLTEKINFQELFYCIIKANEKFNENLQELFGLLVNDQVFKYKFSTVNFKIVFEKIAPMLIDDLDVGEFTKRIDAWNHFWFHSYSLTLYKYNIEKFNWDWVEFAIQMLKYTKESIKFIGEPGFSNEIPDVLMNALDLSDASEIQPNEQTQLLFDRFNSQILNCGTTKGLEQNKNDTIIVSSFKDEIEDNSLYSVFFYFNFVFYQIIDCFKSKKNLKLDKMFEEFDKIIDISPIYKIGKNIIESSGNDENENDKFFSRYFVHEKDADDKLYYYKSFHNGASFFFSYPMFYSLLYLIRTDDYNRAKIARILSTKQYQNLRVKLGIVTLKTVLSMVCFHQSLVSKDNEAVILLLIRYIKNPALTSFGIPLVFPLLQLLIGIECADKEEMNEFCFKEFIAFEMAREIGLFDDFDGEDYEDENVSVLQKQMIFTFLYITILLIIERTLFNFNGYKFMKEQIIFGLKQGVSDMNDLKDMFDQSVSQAGLSMIDFNKIISEVATARQKRNSSNSNSNDTMGSGSQDVLFDLKSDVENKNISAINSINSEKVIMNDEITKHPESLLKIPSFEPEESYFFGQSSEDLDCSGLNVRLKEFLMTPTVLAVLYHTLRTNAESESPSVELNDHLAMNILILISKFLSEEGNKNDFDKEIVINYNSTIADLVSKLKHLIFNYKEDNDNATIENTLISKSFTSFLKIKISPDNKEPKSFVDLLLEKGEIGKKVLTEMSIVVEGMDNKKEKEDINKLKKDRVNKLKQDIMNHYKSMTASFNANDEIANDESLTPTNTEKDICSICSMTKSKEVLSFPLYIYKTKIPFIVDKPPLITMKLSESLNEIDVTEDNDLDQEEDIINNDDDDDDEENDHEPTLDDLFAGFLASHPELMLNDDMDDEMRENVLMMHQMIRDTISNRIERMKEEKAEKRQKRLEEKRILEEKRKQRQEELQKIENDPNSQTQTVVKQLTAGLPYVIQFGICQHPVHHTCVGDKKLFTCPIDRSPKNGFLPFISDLSNDVIFASEENNTNNLSEELKDALETFIKKYSLLFTNQEIDVFVELIKSLSGLIATYEIRLRNLPGCLDSKKNKLLARNLFLATWYAYRMRGKPELMLNANKHMNVDSRLTVYQKFVRKLIENDDIEKISDDEFNQLVKSSLESFKNEKEICLFLRRAYLTQSFLLAKNIDENQKFIDWDEILSAENLSQKFGVTFKSLNVEEFEFRQFTFTKLPKEFLRFSQKPFNLPVDKTHVASLFRILDYNYMIKNYDDFADDEIEKDEEAYQKEFQIVDEDETFNSFLNKYCVKKNYPTILLFIGAFASDILVTEGNRIVNLRPFYLDKYGCADVGYKRGQPLFLNEERYDRFMDVILSGDFTNELRAIPH